MAIAGRRRTHDKGDVKPRIANFPNGVGRSSLDQLQIDGGVLFTKLTQELGKKANRD
jgi:hypothetical protein